MSDAYLRKLSAVERLSEADVAAARGLCHHLRNVPRRRDIISAGETPEFVNVMIDGWAARYSVWRDGRRRITAFLVPGDFCDLHITTLSKMDHGIMAITDCRVGLVPAAALEFATRSSAVLTRAFWISTLVDEAVLRHWLVNLHRGNAIATPAHLFCELHVRLRLVVLVVDDTFDLPLTQDEIADAIGVTQVHANRTLQEMRERGLIDLRRGQLIIPDVERLRDVAEFDPDYLHLRAVDAEA